MLSYTLLLHGLAPVGDGIPGALLRDLLDAVDRGARGSVRLRLEGRSGARGGPPPAWVTRAAEFRVTGSHVDGTPGVDLAIPTLAEALPRRFARRSCSRPSIRVIPR